MRALNDINWLVSGFVWLLPSLVLGIPRRCERMGWFPFSDETRTQREFSGCAM